MARARRCDLPGAGIALVLALPSFTPSLLPRPPEFQGLLVGVNGALGYGVGLVAAWIWREPADRPVRRPRAGAWRLFGVTAAVSGTLAVLVGERWQRQLRDLVGLPGVSSARLRARAGSPPSPSGRSPPTSRSASR